MYCTNCGMQIDDDVVFCGYCGQRLDKGEDASDAEADSPDVGRNAAFLARKKGKRRLFVIAAVVAVAALIIGIGFFGNSEGRELQKQLDLGAKYINELEYEQALACYLSAVEIDPMSVDAYLGIIEVYIRTGEYDLALEWAEKGYELTGDEQLSEKAEMIRSGNISRWDGQPVKMTQYDANGNVLWWHEYTYDKENRKDSTSHYGADGSLIKTLPCIYDEEGNWLEGSGYSLEDGELHRMVRTYEEGHCVAETWYENDDTTIESWTVYEYDAEGNEIRSVVGVGQHIGDEAEISGYTETEHDEHGNQIKESSYDKDYKLKGYSVFEYDEENRCIKHSSYGADGSLGGFIVFEYNEKGERISEKYYDGSGELEYEDIYG